MGENVVTVSGDLKLESHCPFKIWTFRPIFGCWAFIGSLFWAFIFLRFCFDLFFYFYFLGECTVSFKFLYKMMLFYIYISGL
jgi:hypothetical protein